MYRGKPIQLLNETEDGFELDVEALKSVLEQDEIKDMPVVLISVAGEMRGGKSFILNFFLRYLQSEDKDHWLGGPESPLGGFTWKNGDERDTTGILLWSEPSIVTSPSGEQYAVLLLDTQGTFDKKSMKKNAMIFALSTMVSSMQIFNLHKHITEDKLQFLRLFTCYGRMAMSEGNSDDRPFQHLQFLVRDWGSAYNSPYGMDGGASYLKKQLHYEESDPAEIIEVRKFIEGCFTRTDCCLLPHPGMTVISDEIFQGQLQDIDSKFIAQLSAYLPKVLSPGYMLPKAINGSKVTSIELMEYFKAYFKVFSSDEMPEPVDIFKATSEASNMVTVGSCKRVYTDAMNKVCAPDTKHLSESRLRKEHDSIRLACIKKFDTTKKFGDKQYADQYRFQLEKDIDEAFLGFVDKNAKKNTLEREAWSLILLLIWYVLAQLVRYVLLLVGLESAGCVLTWAIYVLVLSAVVWLVAYWAGNDDLKRHIDHVLSRSWECALSPAFLQMRRYAAQSLARNTLQAM